MKDREAAETRARAWRLTFYGVGGGLGLCFCAHLDVLLPLLGVCSVMAAYGVSDLLWGPRP